jgi:hypothetical protein
MICSKDNKPCGQQGVCPECPLLQWKEAIIDECCVTEIGWDENNPRESLKKLIDWHVSVALDPRVSQAAQDLVNRGRRMGPLREVPPEIKAVLEEASKTRSQAAALPNGSVVFINYGDQPWEGEQPDECPHCHGSGLKEDNV